MAEIKYEVVVEYKLAGDLRANLPALGQGAGALAITLEAGKGHAKAFGGAMGGAAGEARALWDAIGRGAGTVADAFTGAMEKAAGFAKGLAFAAGAAGVGAMAYGVAGLNSELEKTQIALADILTSNGVTANLTSGMGMAAGLMKQIRADAAALPGETSDLALIFKMAAIPGLRTGASVGQLEKLSATAMAFGMGTAGMDSGTVARELSMLLGGRAGAHNVLGVQLAGLTGSSAQSFNAMSGGDRFKFLDQALSKHAGSIELYGQSFEGLYSTVKDTAKLLLSNTTSPLFEHVKVTLKDISGWFEHNQASINAFTGRLGDGLARAWDRGTAIFRSWLPAVQAFASNAFEEIRNIWADAQPYVEAFGRVIKNALADPATIGQLRLLLEAYSAVKLGGMLAPAVGGSAKLLGAAATPFVRGLWGAAGGAGGAEAGLGAAGVAEGAAVGGLDLAGAIAGAIPAIAALGVAAAGATAAFGEFSAIADKTSRYHAQAIQAAANLEASGRNLKSGLSGNDLMKTAAEAWGTYAAGQLAGLLDLPRQLAEQNGLGGWLTTSRPTPWGAKSDTSIPGWVAPPRSVEDPRTFPVKDKKKDAPAGPTTINNYFTISSNHDPSRIARDVVSLFETTRRFPTQSRHVRNPRSV